MLSRRLPTCGFVYVTSLLVNESMDTTLVVDHNDLVVFAPLFDLEGVVALTIQQFVDAVLVITSAVAIFHDGAVVTVDAVALEVL